MVKFFRGISFITLAPFDIAGQHLGRGIHVFPGGSATAPPQGTETQHCPFWGVPFYLCIQPLTQNDEI